MASTEDRFVRLGLDAKTHSKFRILAATQGRSMAKVAREVVSNFVEERSAEAEARRGEGKRSKR